MKRRRIGPWILVAIFVGAGVWSYVRDVRVKQFDTAFAELLTAAQTKTSDVASGKDTAESFFAWLAGDGLKQLEALPPPAEGFQAGLLAQVQAMFGGMVAHYQQEPLEAMSQDNYRMFYEALSAASTSQHQARTEPAQF